MIKYVNGVEVKLTDAEIAEINSTYTTEYAFNFNMQMLRAKRNGLLAETDWWGASDNTMTDAQKKYRKDLRDLTAGLDTVEKVNAVVWPTKP
jgi:hypothetical protein